MIIFANGVTSGYLPLGGVIVSGAVAEPFWSEPGGPVFRHGATYAGHPVCCAAALCNLDVLERERLIPRGRELEQPLVDSLLALRDHPLVGAVRGGVGALAALDLDRELLDRQPGAVGELARRARERGVIVRTLGAGVAVSPPLTATAEQFALITEALGGALDEMLAAAKALPASAPH
jgi:adenosylmethionine-8-amino-7-oxononanoate aminotransferase